MNKPITDKEMREWTKREWEKAWKGLTADETMALMNETYGNHWADEAHIQRFRKAIEAALRERNT